MKRKIVNSQLDNWLTYQMYLRQCLTLAKNVFTFKNVPLYVDMPYVNQVLINQGSIAWYVDEVMGLIALPYIIYGNRDIYNRPMNIQVISPNGYTEVIKGQDNFVIMYDNAGCYPIYLDICQYAERLALCSRTIDVNITQQKTPRIWVTSQDQVESLKQALNECSSNADQIMTYDGINLVDTTSILSPAPYVSGQVEEEKTAIWNEFLRYIGIANLTYQKKERNIRDEIQAMQGGTIASRSIRYEPRAKAIKEIKEKFGYELEVEYYDGLPTTLEDNNLLEGGDFNNVL